MADENTDALTEAEARERLGIDVSDSAGDTVVDMEEVEVIEYGDC